MMALSQHIQSLLRKRLDRQPLTDAEQTELKEWYATVSPEWETELATYIAAGADQPALDDALRKFMATAGFKDQTFPEQSVLLPVRRVHFLRTAWFRYAAVFLLIAGGATFLYRYNHQANEIANKQQQKQQRADIPPGGNKAILTLNDGSTIVLDSSANGALTNQGSTRIVKLDAGSLAYHSGAESGTVGMNTISTPKGGQYQIVLPDGSKVWLNAASSITFPTAFGKDRSVSVTGEVYLEVAADKEKPFLVSINDMEVQVLGTRFNISAYSDEPNLRTTLFDGSIKVLNKMKPHSSVLLKPGEQAVYKDNITINKSVDLEQVSAWKNGVFNFNGATLEVFMRQIARWYDVDIIYEGAIPYRIFKGEMGRDLQLSQVMNLLTQFNIKFKQSGKTITIQVQ